MAPGPSPDPPLPSRLPQPLPGRTFSRRSVLKGLLAAGVAAPSMSALLAACGGGGGSTSGASATIPAPTSPVRWPLSETFPAIESGLTPEPGSTLRLYNYADYLAPSVIKAFEKQYDVDVRLSTFNDADEALVKVASGDLAFDIYFPSYDSLGRLVQGDLLRPLNQDYISNMSTVWPAFLDPWYDLGWQYSVPYTVYTTGIGWRVDMIDEDIGARANPYDVFWDPQYAGKLAILDDFHTAMAMVLLRNGIYDVNTTDPDHIALMREQLLELREQTQPRVTISMYNDLPAGQYGLAQMWSGDIVNAQYYLPRGTSADILRYWFPTDGRGMVDNDLMVVLGQGENPVAAHHFINFLLDAQVAAENFAWNGYQPPQRKLTPRSMVRDGYIPENIANATVLPSHFIDGVRILQLPPDADAAYHLVWQEFKAGG